MNNRNNIKKGFTLIELIVVISIIGILAAVAIVGYSGAQSRSRDTKRKADVELVATALQIYHNDSKKWAVSGAGYNNGGQGYFNLQDGDKFTTSIANKLLSLNYLSSEPKDPKLPVDNEGNVLNLSPQYMVYLCYPSGQNPKTTPNGTVVYAQLENPTAVEEKAYEDAIDSAKSNCDFYSDADMNYATVVK